tara:strand:- start:202 stop:432 length:231 start_codon:yes stop_codon:yes gene_type:complete
MKYGIQVQGALNRLDQTLLALNRLIKEGKNEDAIRFMEEGALKDAYEELQNIITISGGAGSTANLGARGTQNTGTL